MIRQWEITTYKNGEYGTFRFNGENKAMALDHVETLKYDIDFEYLYGKIICSGNYDERVREIACRFVGWVKE